MAVSAGVINKRAAASGVYTVLYSINKGWAEHGAYGGTGTPLLWYDSSVSTHTREYHLTMSTHTHTPQWRDYDDKKNKLIRTEENDQKLKERLEKIISPTF